MKKIVSMMLVLLSVACSDKSEKTEASKDFIVNLSESFIINPDTALIDISSSLSNAELDAEGNLLYTYDTRRDRMDIFDLKNQSHKESVIFNHEGPNGTGPVNGFSFSSDERILIRSYGVLNLFTLKGEKYESISSEDMHVEDIEHKEDLFFTGNSGVADTKIENYYSLYDSLNTGKKGIVRMDLNKKNVNFFPVQGMDVFTKLDFGPLSFPPKISYVGEKVMLSHSMINDLLVFDTDKQTIETKDYRSALVADEAKATKPQGADRNRLAEYMAELRKQVFFKPPVFDASNQLHYRLSLESSDNFDEFEMVLSIFDKDLNFLFEKRLDKGYLPSRYFARNGQLIILSNVEDQLQVQKLQITEE